MNYGIDKPSFKDFQKKLIDTRESKDKDKHLEIFKLISMFMNSNSISFSTMIHLIIHIFKSIKAYVVLKDMSAVVYRYNKINYDMEKVYLFSLCNILANN